MPSALRASVHISSPVLSAITSCCPSHVRPVGKVSPEGRSPCSTAFPGVYVPSALRASVHISPPVASAMTSCCPSHVRPRGVVSPEGKLPLLYCIPRGVGAIALRASVHISSPVASAMSAITSCCPSQVRPVGKLAQKGSPLALLHSQGCTCVPSTRSPPAPRPAALDSPSR